MTRQLQARNWGLRATAIVALALSATAASADSIRYYHLDGLGNVRAVTNEAGVVVERHDYLPFGEEWCPGPPPGVCGAPPPGQPRRFTGKERDAETGLDYFGARYYGSKIGRFTTVDPAYTWRENLLDPQRWNRYSYVRNNPLKYVDPDGRAIDVAVDVVSIGYDLFDIGESIHRGEGISGTQILALGGDVVGAAVPFVTGIGAIIRAGGKFDDAAHLAKAAQLSKNKQTGAAFEQLVVTQKKTEQTGVVEQLTIKTDSGVRTRLDIAGRDASGNLRLTEAKASETARLTPNQTKGFPEISRTGGTIAGQGKPGFPGGSRVPPTEVEVCRPCEK